MRPALRRRSVTDSAALNRFLAGVERRAFRMARLAVKDVDEAMDIVQDTMLTLVRKYADKGEGDWPPLFHRILQNRITDWHRRRIVRSRVMMVLGRSDGAEEVDPIQQVADGPAANPEYRVQLDAVSQRMAALVEALPHRQQQAFLLRTWEGLSVAATARAMRCSQGSVKTHYSRAIHRLRSELTELRPELPLDTGGRGP
ncbi:MAG: RNA polymerase sigma factor [Gammaproteobacteria bacterium]|nr:MAG: RNA polymerase sigma factor [Gammaproteobacteria bacterium]